MGTQENWNIWEEAARSAPGVRGWLWRGLIAIATVTLLVVATGCGPHGPGRWHGHHGFWGHERPNLDDVEGLKEHAAWALDWGLDAIDADDEQQVRIEAIAFQAIDRLVPLARAHRDHREALVTELGNPEIDRAALAEIRLKELRVVDEMSAVLLDALADVSEVLTPEQRGELIARSRRFRH
jgi:Spy/CpxP family protein refolding chaperone